MKKGLLLLLCLALLSCAARHQMSPEAERISSVSDTANCKFIKSLYFEVRPQTLNHYLKLNTDRYGGDSFKIINTSTERVSGLDIMMVNMEVYKCK